MYAFTKRTIAAILATAIPACLSAAPAASVTGETKSIHARETSAKTAADHLWIASYYESRAQVLRSDLGEAWATMARWSFMEGREKTPNAYSHAKSLVSLYSEELRHATLRADEHRKLAASLPQQTAMK